MNQHNLPESARKVKKVSIYYYEQRVNGFSFYDRSLKVVFDIGFLKGKVTDVYIEPNEQIIGIKAYFSSQTALISNFQFIICKVLA